MQLHSFKSKKSTLVRLEWTFGRLSIHESFQFELPINPALWLIIVHGNYMNHISLPGTNS